MPPIVIELSGWLPAIIIPTATLIQLYSVAKSESSEGVSRLTWTLFGIANIGLFIYTEKYTSIQAIVGLLGPAVMDFMIVALVLLKGRERRG